MSVEEEGQAPPLPRRTWRVSGENPRCDLSSEKTLIFVGIIWRYGRNGEGVWEGKRWNREREREKREKGEFVEERGKKNKKKGAF